jgi:uncharacterized membrane protein (DUF485 family)
MSDLAEIARSDTYQRLVRERSRLAWVLTAIMLTVYFGFILLVAFNRELLARPIGGGTTTLGIPLGLGVIVTGVMLTWVYVARANRRFDALTRDLLREAGL